MIINNSRLIDDVSHVRPRV